MKFTGYNLILVSRALCAAAEHVQNEIATCPDVNQYAEELEDLHEERRQYERLASRVSQSIRRERTAAGLPLESLDTVDVA